MRKISFAATLVGAAIMAAAVCAQAPTPITPILVVNRVVVKPDRITEWLEVEKLYTEAHKKGGGAWRRVYRAASGRAFEYMVTAPLSDYAALDGESAIAKGSTEAERARWAARRAQCTESVQTSYERYVPDAGINTVGATSPKLMSVTRYQVRAGMADQFVEFVKAETIPVLKKAGVSLYVLRRTDFGGSRWSYVARRGMDKWADVSTNLTEKVLGKEGAAKYFAKSATLLSNVTVDVYVFVPELSYVRAQ